MRIKMIFKIALMALFAVVTYDPMVLHAQADTSSPWLVQAPTDYESALTVVRDQLTAIRINDPSKAYYAYTTKGFRKSFSLEDFKNMIRRFKVFYQNKSFKAEDAAFEGTTIVKLTGKILAADGEAMNAKFDVVLEDGEWKIQSIYLYQISPRARLQR
jgi:hypothetical protein